MYQMIAEAAKQVNDNIIGAVNSEKYDYGQEGANEGDAIAAQTERAAAIGKNFGPLGELFGTLIGKAKAIDDTRRIFGNRDMKKGMQEELMAQKSIADERMNQINQAQQDRIAGINEFKNMELNLTA